MEQFVQAYRQDAQFRQTLTWRSDPLALYHKQHADQANREAAEQANQQGRNQKERSIFSAVVRELQRHGTSIANTDANFEVCRQHLHYDLGLDFTIDNALSVLKAGSAQGTEKYGTLNLSQNDPGQVEAMDQQDRDAIYASVKPRLAYRQDLIAEAKKKIAQLSIPELRTRVDACTTLADDYSKDPRSQDPVFTSHFASLSSTADLQAKAAVVLENRRLRSLTPQQLREEAAAARPQAQKYEYPQLPPEYYDGYKIVASSAPQIKELLRRYGREQVDAAINRYKTLQTSYNQGDSYTRF